MTFMISTVHDIDSNNIQHGEFWEQWCDFKRRLGVIDEESGVISLAHNRSSDEF